MLSRGTARRNLNSEPILRLQSSSRVGCANKPSDWRLLLALLVSFRIVRGSPISYSSYIMKEPLNIVKMKMWWVQVGDAEKQLCGLTEKDFYLSVFKDCCHVEEIELDSDSDSSTMVGDERSN